MLFITVPFIYTMDAYIKTGDEPNMMTPNGVNGHERVNRYSRDRYNLQGGADFNLLARSYY